MSRGGHPEGDNYWAVVGVLAGMWVLYRRQDARTRGGRGLRWRDDIDDDSDGSGGDNDAS